MAKTTLTPIVPLGAYPSLPVSANGLDFAFQTASAQADGFQGQLTGREILVLRNTGAGSNTFTIQSTPDSRNREGDVGPYTLGAGEFAAFAAFALEGWRQTDGNIYVDISSTEVVVAMLRLPQ